MIKIPQIEPISKMKHDYNSILQRLADGPLVLTQHGRAAAIVVSPAEWNRAMEERENLFDIIAALRAELALERGEEDTTEIDTDTFIAEVSGESV